MGILSKRTLMLCAVCVAVSLAAGADPILIADFEGSDYGGWQVEGDAFGRGPAKGTLPGQMRVGGYRGDKLANSYYGRDASTGKLISPPFVIERPFISFLIGGGMHPGKTCMNLIVKGEVVRTATGPNDRPGGTESLEWESWDVKDLQGQRGLLEIVDSATGGWGHVNIDHIVQSDRSHKLPDLESAMICEKRYINFPVKTGAAMRQMKMTVDGEVVREFDIELASEDPDFWVFLDLTPFAGKEATLTVKQVPEDDPDALSKLPQTDSFMGAEDLYREPMRPQFHFSPRRGWNNDPNGLVYYKGEYHLYFQHNPYGWNWGNMHWGHAVSTDLVHWEELPIAIYPAEFGDWAFSGGALVDVANTGGFKTGDEDVIVAAYTSTGRGESIAFSNDRGRTFTDYEGNPVVKHQGRDPKIIWYEPGGHWSMAVYDERDGKRGIAFHTSPDLKAWTYQSWIDGYYECPEIFPLAVDGNPDQVKWVVYGADGDYSIGAFDGKTFTAESGKHKGNCGNCFYASQTFSDLPAEDGRRIQIGWGRVATPGMPFNQMMLFPCVLTLRTTDDGVRMFTEPVGEIENVHEKVHELQDVTLKPGENPLSDISGDLFDVELAISMGEASAVALTVRGTTVRYDAKAQTLSCGDCEAPVRMRDGMVDLRVLVDRTTVEIFANGGEVYMPVGVMAKGDEVSLAAEGSACTVTHMKVAELRSAWK